MSIAPHATDLQQARPAVSLALDAAGVTGVRRLVHGGAYAATIDAHVDLGPSRRGVHMSRFHEVVTEAIDATIAGDRAATPDVLAADIAAAVAERQGGQRAAVSITALAQAQDRTPESDLLTLETFEVLGRAAVDVEAGTARRALGVRAVGMNACPCAQELVRGQARTALEAAGFDGAQVERILDVVPVATHNQRGTGTLLVGTRARLDPLDLLAVVHAAMSARIHELLKRGDELAVVATAHANPMFVEDGVRELVAGALASGWSLHDDDMVSARLVNLESIHAHDVFAERTGLVGDLRRELSGDAPERAGDGSHHLTVDAWLHGPRA